MHIRPNTLVADDLDDIHVTASSAEPMRRADHKSKKHGRPARQKEVLGGGHFVFRRHEDGRIHPRQDPFEHRTIEEATTEMQRLVDLTGERFEVFSRSAFGGVKWEAVDDAHTDGWTTRRYADRDGRGVKYETCYDCDGSGLALNGAGEPDECAFCRGDTVVPQIGGAA